MAPSRIQVKAPPVISPVPPPLSKPNTLTGVLRSMKLPSPSCPLSFLPQHFTAPLNRRAHVCAAPAAIDCTPLVSPATSTGVELNEPAAGEPSCPALLSPQQRTPPE